MLKAVLVALDNTPSTGAAIHHAKALARDRNAHVTGIAVLNDRRLANVGMIPIGAGMHAKRLREHRLALTNAEIDEAISNFERAYADSGIRYDVQRVIGNPLDQIASRGRCHDLTLIGSGFLFHYGVIDEPWDPLCRLMNRGLRPVLCVAAQCQTVKNVLIALNESTESFVAMKHFAQLELWPQATTEIAWCSKRSAPDTLMTAAREYCRLHRPDSDVRCHLSIPK